MSWMSLILIGSIIANIIMIIFCYFINRFDNAKIDLLAEYETLYENIKINYVEAYREMQRMDNLGAYEANDELGVFFSFIKDTLNDFNVMFADENELTGNMSEKKL